MKKLPIIFLIIVLLVSLVALPRDTEAKTIAEFEEEVRKFTAELQAKKDSLTKNQAEIEAIKQRITNIYKQIQAAEAEIITLQDEIDESNQEIKKKGEESKAIIEYYQI